MPITGKEADLEAVLVDSIKAAVTFYTGSAPIDDMGIKAVSKGIADALIPFLTANIQVNTGQNVGVPGDGLSIDVSIDTDRKLVVDPELTPEQVDQVLNYDVQGDATGTVSTSGTIS